MGELGREEFRVNMFRCLSDLDHWIEANEHTYDPIVKEKTDILQVQVYLAEHAVKYLLKTSIDNLGMLTNDEIHALRFCISSGMTITTDEKLYKNLQECLSHIRKKSSSTINV